MKKYHVLGTILICAVFILSCPAQAQIGPEKPFGTDFYKSLPGNPFYLRAVVCLNDTFYGYLGDYIYQWHPGDDQPVLYTALPPSAQWKNTWLSKAYKDFSSDDREVIESAVDYIASGDGNVWGYNTRSGKIGKITSQGVDWAETPLDTSFLYVNDSFIIRMMPIDSFVEDGKLYIFAINHSRSEWLTNEPMVLIRFDITSGKYDILSTNNAINLCRYKPGYLLIACQGDSSSMIISQMNTTTGEIIDLPVKIPFQDQSEKDEAVNEVGGLSYDEQNDRIYFVMDNNIYRSTNSQAFEKAGSLQKQFRTTFHTMLGGILPDGRYALSSPEGLYLFIMN